MQKRLADWSLARDGMVVLFVFGCFLVIILGTSYQNQACFRVLASNVDDLDTLVGRGRYSVRRSGTGDVTAISISSGTYTREHGTRWRSLLPALALIGMQLLLRTRISGPVTYGAATAIAFGAVTLLINSLSRHLNGATFRPSITAFVSVIFYLPLAFAVCAVSATPNETERLRRGRLSIETLKMLHEHYAFVVRGLVTILLITVLTFSFRLLMSLSTSQPPILEDYHQYYLIVVFSWGSVGYVGGLLVRPMATLTTVVKGIWSQADDGRHIGTGYGSADGIDTGEADESMTQDDTKTEEGLKGRRKAKSKRRSGKTTKRKRNTKKRPGSK